MSGHGGAEQARLRIFAIIQNANGPVTRGHSRSLAARITHGPGSYFIVISRIR